MMWLHGRMTVNEFAVSKVTCHDKNLVRYNETTLCGDNMSHEYKSLFHLELRIVWLKTLTF